MIKFSKGDPYLEYLPNMLKDKDKVTISILRIKNLFQIPTPTLKMIHLNNSISVKKENPIKKYHIINKKILLPIMKIRNQLLFGSQIYDLLFYFYFCYAILQYII
jgi:hypothetical protein